jgi:hypothetical protein
MERLDAKAEIVKAFIGFTILSVLLGLSLLMEKFVL